MNDQERASMSRRGFLKSCLATMLGLGVLGGMSKFDQLFALEQSETLNSNSISDLGIVFGTTPIVGGRATHEKDFTIYNGKIAASFVVGSIANWNMTKGSILDVAVMQDGKPAENLIDDVEFLHDLWVGLGSYNGEDVLHNPVGEVAAKRISDQIVVTTKMPYWTWTCGQIQALDMAIEYTLRSHDTHIAVKTTISNPENNQPYRSLLSAKHHGNFRRRLLPANAKHGERIRLHTGHNDVSFRLDGTNGCRSCLDAIHLHPINPGQRRVFKGEILVAGGSENVV